MQVLHSLWDTKAFYIWAESSALPQPSAGSPDDRNRKHPFALPGRELRDHLSKTFRLDGSRLETLVLRLPSGKSGPLPSPWLLREDFVSEKPSSLGDCTVPALLCP
jgi:hypothetical protein